MEDDEKTKEQLISDLAELRQQVAELDVSATGRKRAEGGRTRTISRDITDRKEREDASEEERKQMEEALRKSYPELEERVDKWTAELKAANEQLQKKVAECKQAEEALQESEERFHKIFDYSNDAIFVMDPAQDKFLEVNPKACSMLGYSRDELGDDGESIRGKPRALSAGSRHPLGECQQHLERERDGELG